MRHSAAEAASSRPSQLALALAIGKLMSRIPCSHRGTVDARQPDYLDHNTEPRPCNWRRFRILQLSPTGVSCQLLCQFDPCGVVVQTLSRKRVEKTSVRAREVEASCKRWEGSPRVDGVAELLKRLQVGVQLHDGDEADIDVLAYGREPRPTQSALAPSSRSPAQVLRWKGGPKRGLTFIEMRLGLFFALLELDL